MNYFDTLGNQFTLQRLIRYNDSLFKQITTILDQDRKQSKLKLMSLCNIREGETERLLTDYRLIVLTTEDLVS